MSKNTKKTSAKIAKLAAKTLTNSNSSTIAKELAGSALSQVDKSKQTGSKLETKASKVLTSSKYNEDTKKLAASLLSQSDKER
ncbi:hypothetical protein HX069_12095 [Myroides odoratimimus]|uniref:hypothetical protein n=1 Tax=Myroides odoratimimus TaxID=76832 RepID=UPI0025764DF0|nr:hypothetical protein [Myroides odoratimimus]MDM1679890.1 hypothetical protein [Myroides odoratimimus]